ncbi:MAG: hypothetical protein N3B01_06965 [Verrucomicrobiae bacterium]|nr:hypothetical protein [Verrucomicrobiae bacterium]
MKTQPQHLAENRRAFLRQISSGIGAVMLGGVGGDAASQPSPGAKEAVPVTSGKKKKNLLFFFSDETCPSAGAVTATLHWVAEKTGNDFDAYICIRPKTWAGEILAFTGHSHAEQFYYAANFYQKVLYCALTESPALQFKREVMAFGGDIIAVRTPRELFEFYQDVFSYFKLAVPKEIVVLPDRPRDKDALWLQPFCYPEVSWREALGLNAAMAGPITLKRLKTTGAEQVTTFYCPEKTLETARAIGLRAVLADSVKEGDSYGSITCRIADRWLGRARGIAFGDPHCTLKWMPFYLRERYLTLYEPVEWRAFTKTLARYAQKTGNRLIYGSQTVKPFTDDVATEFAKEGLIMSLTGPDARVGITIQSQHTLPVDWLREIRPPWEEEYSDKYLEERAVKGRIPVCFLFYASDIGHLPALPRVLDLMLVDGMRCGLAFPSTWYNFQPQLLEQLYIPVQHGGVYPKVEPLLASAGQGVAAEAQGHLDEALLVQSLKEAKKQIALHVGENLVPPGYYPFQDACPGYKHGTGEPQFAALEKAGVQYCITYKHEQEFPRIVYESDKLIVLNQQTLHWFPSFEAISPLDRLKDWEMRIPLHRRAGWIILGFDLPFYGLCPAYLGGWKPEVSMDSILRAMQYAASGGKIGRLFLAKPHEVVRYAKILQKLGKL